MNSIKFQRFDNLLKFLPKSKLKAGNGQERGKYPFFKSGNDQTKFIDTAIFEGESLIIGDGGSANVNFYGKKFSASDHCYVIQKGSQDIEVKYVYYYLKSNLQILEAGFKGAGLKNISKKYISEIKIPLFPLPEQQKIAGILSQIEELINKREESIKLLDELTKSTFLEMFGDPIINPKNWESVTLGSISSDFKYGTNEKSDSYTIGSIPILRIPNIGDAKLDYNDMKYAILSEQEYKKLKLKTNDLLFIRSNGNPDYIGKCLSFNEDFDCAYASYLIRVRLTTNEILSKFIELIISTNNYRKYIKKEARTSAGNYNINTPKLKQFLIIKPPLILQKQFLDILSRLEQIKTIYQNSLTELNNLFGSIAQKSFKGELDVSKIELMKKEQEETIMEIKLSENKLIEEIKKSDFQASKYVNKHQNYDAIKNMIFKLIEEGKISQKFDDKSKEIILETK